MTLIALKNAIDQMLANGVDHFQEVVVDYPPSWDSIMFVEDWATEYRGENNKLIKAPVLILKSSSND